MKLQTLLLAAALAVALSACSTQTNVKSTGTSATVTLEFPSDKFPETGAHIRDAINAGESAVCTIDRPDEAAHRKLSLKDVPTRKGYDRDEWPMAMCKEGGAGANVRYINPSDNRGAGAWVSGQLKKYPDGTAVKFIVK